MFPQSQGVRSSNVARLPEVLDNLKSEFEQLSHEASVYKAQRDENERKCKFGFISLVLNIFFFCFGS